MSCCNVLAATLKANIEEQASVQRSSVKSQEIIDELSLKTTDVVYEYQQITEQLDTLKIYNQQLSKLVLSQNELISTRTQQLNSIEQTEQSIVPLMLQMISTLEQFIHLDTPFLLDERQQRVDSLKLLMDQADETSAEKYRQILEAFLIEMDYGRTIEAWQGIHPDDQSTVVNYFRIGRIVLVYQSLDGKNAFYWSKNSAQYKPLSPEYRSSLERGFRVARKQTAPEFISLPVSIPETIGDASNE
ncbi:MAG: DUF3450 domain-containing protein [Gammaproteobacteria bacterium]|nr:DUF3450 domain-containing protein [Gammaproteobacteria bacterium]